MDTNVVNMSLTDNPKMTCKEITYQWVKIVDLPCSPPLSPLLPLDNKLAGVGVGLAVPALLWLTGKQLPCHAPRGSPASGAESSSR